MSAAPRDRDQLGFQRGPQQLPIVVPPETLEIDVGGTEAIEASRPAAAGAAAAADRPESGAGRCGRASPLERLDEEADQRLLKYKQGESLGRGAYGEVFKAMVAGRFMAVKKIPLDAVGLRENTMAAEKEINTLLLEINTLKRLKHPRIVRYHGCVRQEEDPALLIFLEFMPSGSIKGVLTKFGPYGLGLVRKYTRQILEGLEFLHAEQIVHRDVKGANILIDAQGDAKLADFGACREMEALQSIFTGGLKSIHGSVYWMAPEVMKYRAGRRSDIWSLGCTVIEMMTAEPPWPNLRVDKLSLAETLKRIVDSDDVPPFPEVATGNARHFLEIVLVRDHTKRHYAPQLLRHRFVRQELAPAAAAGSRAADDGPGPVAPHAWGAPSPAPSPEPPELD